MSEPSLPSRYPVEHQQPIHSTVLAGLCDARSHHRPLDPFLSRLIHEGRTGWTIPVDGVTDQDVAIQPVDPPLPGDRGV